MNYKINDIVNRAKQLADLENSNFISWKENNSLLNESYIKLYTESINHDDKTFLKTVNVNELEQIGNSESVSSFLLPEDFFMLGNVSTKTYNREILRKAKGESFNSDRYDLIGDKLYLYGNMKADTIILSYYPTPETLIMKAPEKVISLPEDYIYLDCNDNNFMGYKEKGNDKIDVIIYNIEKARIKTIELDAAHNVTFGLLGKKNFIIEIGNNTVKYDLVTDTEATITDIPGKVDGYLYYFNLSDTNVKYKKENSTGYIETTIPSVTVTGIANTNRPFTMYIKDGIEYTLIVSNTDNELYLIKDIEVPVKIADITDNIHYCFIGEDLYYVNDNIMKNNEVLLQNEKYWSFVGFNKCDVNTGYGLTVITEFDEYTVFSSYTDMSVTFPNNFYFEYVAFMLAIAYKTKQNADSSALTEQANRESFQFYNSLNKDINNNVRINNVYLNGGWN